MKGCSRARLIKKLKKVSNQPISPPKNLDQENKKKKNLVLIKVNRAIKLRVDLKNLLVVAVAENLRELRIKRKVLKQKLVGKKLKNLSKKSSVFSRTPGNIIQ